MTVQIVRIQMLRNCDQLVAGRFYNMESVRALVLIHRGDARAGWPERKPAGPSEIKPAEPSEIKTEAKVKKNSKRGRTENESS